MGIEEGVILDQGIRASGTGAALVICIWTWGFIEDGGVTEYAWEVHEKVSQVLIL